MKQKFPLLDGQLSISEHKEHSTGIYYNSRKSRFLFEDATTLVLVELVTET